jgi:5'-nucleotidase
MSSFDDILTVKKAVKIMSQRPLILFTNDDGIASPALWTIAGAFADIGDILIVAPREQQSGMGRSLPGTSEGRIYPYELPPNGKHYDYKAYAVDGTPAQAVQHGVLELSDRLPSLVVSGINYGENTGNGVTISGTVGAALEGASLGIPSIAISQQMPQDLHLSYSTDIDFAPAASFAVKFGSWLIEHPHRPDDVDVLKIEVPANATPETEWRITRLSRRRVFWPTRPERVALSDIGRLGYHFDADPSQAEPDSDVYAVLHDHVVSVTPISLDLTARTDMFRLRQILSGDVIYNGKHKHKKEPIPGGD